MNKPQAIELTNAGTDRENLIANALLAAIKPEPTDWLDIRVAFAEKVKVKSNGWLEVRGLLQWLINNAYVARVPFDPAEPTAGECYVRLPR